MVELLFRSGADVNVEHRQRGIPLDVVQQRGNEEIIELLLKYGAEPSETGVAPRSGVRGGIRRGGANN